MGVDDEDEGESLAGVVADATVVVVEGVETMTDVDFVVEGLVVVAGIEVVWAVVVDGLKVFVTVEVG
jgi:hypothetical protein